jgi:hypothetical protein
MALIDIDDEFIELFYNITNTKKPQNIDFWSILEMFLGDKVLEAQ